MEACQTAVFFGKLSLGTGYVHLHHLPAGEPLPRIGHLYFHPNFRMVRTQVKMFYSHNLKRKIRIGKAIAEAVAHRHLEGIKIPVAHINSFFIPLLFHISIVMGKRSRIRIISVIISPGIRKLSAWRHLPRQHICHGAAAFHAGLYNI